MKHFLPLLLTLLLLLAPLPSCSSPTGDFAPDDRIKITATLFPQYDFARTVGGDRVQVIKLLPSGTESHTYEPTAKDIVNVSDSDLFLYTGPDMEPWAQTILKGLDSPPTALDLSASVPNVESDHAHEEEDDHDHEHTSVSDPHIWTNPLNAIRMVEAIRDSLIALDPDGKEVYEANSAAYIAELEAIDADLRAIAAQAEEKTLVFAGRFAFAHLCAEYGFAHISAYRGCDVEAEPSASDITAVIDFVKENGITHIFCEPYVNPQSYQTIARETKAAVLQLHSCHNVTSEELLAGHTYLELMRGNVGNIRIALPGEE